MRPVRVGYQKVIINDWVPQPVLNGSRQKHWTVIREHALETKVRARFAATNAGWSYMDGRVRLTVTFVFPVRRKRDTDNLYARAKHLVDGLKGTFFEDDSTDVLDLVVKAEVVPHVKETVLVLERLA